MSLTRAKPSTKKEKFQAKEIRILHSNKPKKMPISRIAVGNPAEIGQADAIKAALAEFFSMLIFVFAGEGSGMAFSKQPI